MTLPRELTQIPAAELVDYDKFLETLRRLDASPRVKLQLLERSREGRGIYAIVVASEAIIGDLDRHRTAAGARQRPQLRRHTLRGRQPDAVGEPPDNLRFAAAVMGESFGHEASHVEALLALAEKLAWSDAESVRAILDRLIVLIVPLVNPDGRDMAIELWRRYPLAEDSSVAGNRYGFYINRDFLHLTQPEGRAILNLYHEWQPISLYDAHEDAFLLGVVTPEVCWFPEDGEHTADLAPRNVQEIINDFGAAIKSAWEAEGYNYYAANMFSYPMPGQPADQPKRGSMGNITGAMGLHGVPSLITESARTPGTQPWHDRVDQKVAAALAVLGQTAANPERIADTIFRNGQANIADAAEDAYIIPVDQAERGGLAELIRVLLAHGIAVYQADQPQPAFIVPRAQSRAPLIDELLSSEGSKFVAMAHPLGLQVFKLSLLEDADAWRDARLRPVIEAPAPRLDVTDASSDTSHVAIPNTLDGLRLVNRLLKAHAGVLWSTAAFSAGDVNYQPGTFIVENLGLGNLKQRAAGLDLRLSVIPAGTAIQARQLRLPRVALYSGQGVDRPHPYSIGELWWGLEKLEFDCLQITQRQITPGWMERTGILIVPEGNAREIVGGWEARTRRNSEQWDLPGHPEGIGQPGLDTLRRYIKAGGHYLGLGSGGGLLATADYLDLIDLSVSADSLGAGRVCLTLSDNSPLTYGLRGYYDEAGQFHRDQCWGMYETESFSSVVGGPIFQAGGDVDVVASFHSVDYDPDDFYVLQPEQFTGAAVATRQCGLGQVTVMGIRPGFRAIWTHSLKLISNSIYLSAAQPEQTVVLK